MKNNLLLDLREIIVIHTSNNNYNNSRLNAPSVRATLLNAYEGRVQQLFLSPSPSLSLVLVVNNRRPSQ